MVSICQPQKTVSLQHWLLLRVSILTTKLLGGKQMTSLFHCYPLGLRDVFAILTMTCFSFFFTISFVVLHHVDIN